MAGIRVENVKKNYDDVVAVDDVSFSVQDREFAVLVGPSGCGKTTLLRAIAGLGDVDSGRIFIGDQDVTRLPPRDRGIAMVFQSYAIFPHLTVADNIAFGLKMKPKKERMSKDAIRQRVQHAAELLHLEDLLQRQPRQLSGGQRQRVAVARAVARQAEVMLMDEPLSNLDPVMRMEMRVELKKLFAKIRTTTLYVTHDQTEAMNMGDRIAVMHEGRLLQFDAPNTIYNLPANRFVGAFFGNPPMNFLEGEVRRENGRVQVLIGDAQLEPVAAMHSTLARHDGQPVVMGIRAEHVDVLREPAPNTLRVMVRHVEDQGPRALLVIPWGQQTIRVAVQAPVTMSVDDTLYLRLPADKIRWIDRASGRALLPDLEERAG